MGWIKQNLFYHYNYGITFIIVINDLLIIRLLEGKSCSYFFVEDSLLYYHSFLIN